MPRHLSWAEVWRERLRRHWLARPAPPEQLTHVVGQVCGIHAQVAVSAELSLGLRVSGLTARGVQAALWQDRRLVKTYGIRGTLHLFPSDELGLWLAALRSVPPLPRPPSSPERISAQQRAEIVQAMHQALDGQRLTRDELGQALADRLGPWVNAEAFPAFGGMWRPWQVALGTAAHQGVLCFGPPRGTRVTYVRLDQWLAGPGLGDRGRRGDRQPDGGRGHPDRLDENRREDSPRADGRLEHGQVGHSPGDLREHHPGQLRQQHPGHLRQQHQGQLDRGDLDGHAALLEVVRRYVAAYGPTTHVELARWLATTPGAARELLSRLDLEPVDVEGWQAFQLPGQPSLQTEAHTATQPNSSRRSSTVHLVPQFDCYVVGCHPRRQLIPPRAPPALHKGTAATFSVLLLDGVVAGLWQRQRRGSRLELVVDPFVELTHAQRQALDEQAHRLAEILGLQPKLSLGHVEPRAHL